MTIIKLRIIAFIKIFLTVAICLLTSFFNYVLIQIIGGGYVLPLTMLSLFYAFMLGYPVPTSLVFLIGILDDLLLNSFLGTYAILYILMIYIADAKLSCRPNTKLFHIFLIAMFILINCLSFYYFN